MKIRKPCIGAIRSMPRIAKPVSAATHRPIATNQARLVPVARASTIHTGTAAALTASIAASATCPAPSLPKTYLK